MNTARRGFLGAVLSFFGFSATSAIAAPSSIKTKGYLVFTINVGGLPPVKAEAFCERIKDRLIKSRRDPAWEIIIMPVRNQETKFEVIVIDSDATTGKVVARQLKAFEILQEQVEEQQEYPTLEQISDYILLHLGAPVVKVELDQKQLELCYYRAIEEIDASSNLVAPYICKDVALAHAKMILGRIRSKYINEITPGPIDGPSLVAEGELELFNLRQQLRG